MAAAFINIFFVSIEFYESIEVTQDYCVSTHNSNCSLENCHFPILLIGSPFDQILQRLGKFHFTNQLSVVFTLCLKTDFQIFLSNPFSSTGEILTNLIALFITVCKEKEQKKCQVFQRKDCSAKTQTSILMF